jgi:hypothetical protein
MEESCILIFGAKSELCKHNVLEVRKQTEQHDDDNAATNHFTISFSMRCHLQNSAQFSDSGK